VIIEPGEYILGFLDDCGSEHPAISVKIKMIKQVNFIILTLKKGG